MTNATPTPIAAGSRIPRQEMASGKTMAILSCVPIALIGLIVAIIRVLRIMNAGSGQCRPLPVIGQFADKWFGGIQKV